MASVPAVVPAEHSSDHVLVMPRPAAGAEAGSEAGPEQGRLALPELAAAWFGDAGWLRAPAVAGPSRGGGGARFHGVRAAPLALPGILRLGDDHRATGPFPLEAGAAGALGCEHPADAWALGRADGTLDARGGRPATYDDRDGISRAFAAALPVGEELRVVGWGVAVARRSRGLLLADGRHALRPDPAASVDLTVRAARVVPAQELLEVVRAVVATAAGEAAAAGAPGHRVVARTPYDGDLVVGGEPAAGPPGAPATVHRLAWVPQDPYELQVEQPSGVHAIARSRARTLLARIALLLLERAGGAAVDDAGFPVGRRELDGRLDSRGPGSRAWV
jgi:hypothetical protein